MDLAMAREIIQRRYDINRSDATMIAEDLLDDSERLGFGKIRTEQRFTEILDELEFLGKEV